MPMMRLCVCLYADYSGFLVSVYPNYSWLKTNYLWLSHWLWFRLRLIDGLSLSYYISLLLSSNIIFICYLLVHLGLLVTHYLRLLITSHTRLNRIIVCRNVGLLLYSVGFSFVLHFRRAGVYCSLSINGWLLLDVL